MLHVVRLYTQCIQCSKLLESVLFLCPRNAHLMVSFSMATIHAHCLALTVTKSVQTIVTARVAQLEIQQ